MEWANRINHIIVIIGWKDDPNIGNGGYWICKNSWGTEWGYDGYFNIEYGTLFTGMIITWPEYDPESFDWAPSANAGGFYQAKTNEEIVFDASSSFDVEGDIISYEWDFGDTSPTNGMTPSHTFSEPGIHRVALTVTDEGNNTATDIALVGIGESPIEIEYTGGLGLTMDIVNPSMFDISDISLSIEFESFFLNTISRNEVINHLPAQDSYSLSMTLIGFGFVTLDIILDNIQISKPCFVLGPFVLIR
jgi:hypothetical protein